MSIRVSQPPKDATTKETQWPLLSTNQGLVESGPFVMVPLAFLQHQYTALSATEVRVMLYIFYRTLGYRDPLTGGRKVADAISHSQFLKGITTHDDKQLDLGAGISERSLDRALDGLQEKGFIKRCRRTDRHGRQLTTMYELNLEAAGAAWLQSSDTWQSTTGKKQHTNPTLQVAHIEAIKHTASDDVSNYKVTELYTEQPQQFSITPEIASPNISEENKSDSYVKLGDEGVITPMHPTLQKRGSQKVIPKFDPAIYTEGSRNFAGVAPVKLRDTKESLNNQIINNQTQTGVVKKKELRLIDTELEQPGPISFEVRQQEKAEQHALVSELTVAGISSLEAKRLAAIIFANGHRAGSYVSECLRYIQRQTGVKSRIGLLVYLIKTNWQPTSVKQFRPESSVVDNRARLVASWAKYSGNELQPELEPAVKYSDSLEIDGATVEFASLCPSAITREECEEVWRQICQKAVEEWGISADKLVGSWLAPVENDPANPDACLQLYLANSYQLTSIRYRLSQLIKTALGLGPTWRIIDSDLTGNGEYTVNDLAV